MPRAVYQNNKTKIWLNNQDTDKIDHSKQYQNITQMMTLLENNTQKTMKHVNRDANFGK